MPHRLKIDQELNCVFIQHYGDVDSDEVLLQIKELGKHPDFVQGMNLLRDFTLTNIPRNYNIDRFKSVYDSWIKQNDRNLGIQRKVAWVLTNKEDFITIHQFCAITRLNNMVAARQPFRDVGNARQFLEIPDKYVIEYPAKTVK